MCHSNIISMILKIKASTDYFGNERACTYAVIHIPFPVAVPVTKNCKSYENLDFH